MKPNVFFRASSGNQGPVRHSDPGTPWAKPVGEAMHDFVNWGMWVCNTANKCSR